jgi:uncharacterized protein YbgA (DUF1722 family)/uncharacterized protein YbbK (DUF523 family)
MEHGARLSSPSSSPIRVGVSACLLGQNVRYDGGHKRDRFLMQTLGRFVDWVPVCPEVELGLGTPREPIRLERRLGEVRLVAPRSGVDHTEAMRRYARGRVASLEKEDLCGYVLKKDSPSCGLERVRIHDKSAPSRSGRGLFAEELVARFPGLPVEEEGRLVDPRLRESFVVRVFAYRRLKDLFTSRWEVGALVAFHTAHKLLLLAHSPPAYASLGRLVAGARRLPRRDLRDRYTLDLMEALARPVTRGRHSNVLLHAMGYISKDLAPAERRELLGVIEDHRGGLLPLVVPLTLLRHHVQRLGVAYLQGQVYLEPHPKELMLRNHV